MGWLGDKDDLTCERGDYVLRAEQMNKGKFWWCVYYKGEQIASDAMTGKFASTMSKAQYYAVYHKVMHEKSNKNK